MNVSMVSFQKAFELCTVRRAQIVVRREIDRKQLHWLDTTVHLEQTNWSIYLGPDHRGDCSPVQYSSGGDVSVIVEEASRSRPGECLASTIMSLVSVFFSPLIQRDVFVFVRKRLCGQSAISGITQT